MDTTHFSTLRTIKVLFAAILMSVALFVGAAISQAPSQAQAATASKYIATIDVKDYGSIQVELDRNAAPKTVDNFVKLANSGFYNGSTFHRIVKNFMIQGGKAPKGKDDAAMIKGEFAKNGWKNPISHTRGVISMARQGDAKSGYNTASSQFFIVHKDSKSLDGNYAAFGHVIGGMDVVDSIASVYTIKTETNDGLPIFGEPVINSIKITPCYPAKGWVKTGSKYRYMYDSATKKKLGKAYPRNEVVAIDGKWYAFDTGGWMKTGWQKIGGKRCYFGTDGARKTGWVKVGGKWYLLNGNGVMLTGWQKVGDDTYYLNSSGVMRTGWIKKSGKWYHLGSSGALTTSSVFSDGNHAYMVDASGVMQTGKQKVNDDHYYFASNGAMKTGWIKTGGKWYYFSPQGPMVTNHWVGVYWVGKDGVMATNSWVNNNKYYVGSNGVWKSGWAKISGKWYFFANTGKVKNKWVGNYWLGKDGVMATSAWVDNGRYYVNSNGVWVPNAKKSSSTTKSTSTKSAKTAAK